MSDRDLIMKTYKTTIFVILTWMHEEIERMPGNDADTIQVRNTFMYISDALKNGHYLDRLELLQR